jgi:alkyldihydroxyacetonephosphate synthase
VSRREQKPWGWGEPGAAPPLSEEVAGFLRSAFGVDGGAIHQPVGLDDVELPPCAIGAGARRRLGELVGEEHVRDDRLRRISRATGKSYLDLLAQRSGRLEAAPDAVVAPGSAEEVQAVLEVCSREDVAVVPFGGGTSVVGGVAPRRGAAGAVITLDLARLDRVVSIDERSRTARFQPGIRLPEADRHLSARGFTLGHHPQSYEWATVGGCVATRSSGQASNGFGRIDDLVMMLRCATPVGELSTATVPASAAGPPLRELLMGSEGAFGVLTELTLVVRPVAEARRYEGWILPSFAEGVDALRRLTQAGLAPDVARLSDETETGMGLALAGTGSLKARSGVTFLRARGAGSGCLLIAGWEGPAEDVAGAARLLRAACARPAAATPVARRARPGAPGATTRRTCATTCWIAACWWRRSRPPPPGRVSRNCTASWAAHCMKPSARRSHGRLPRVALLYGRGVPLLHRPRAAGRRRSRGQWMKAKEAASRAIVGAGATITHHHAVGSDHASYLPAEIGALGIDVLRAMKERCDPAGIMNPGKLLQSPP